jgi:hypothetical protein
MASTLQPLTPLPPPTQPAIDPKTGRIDRDWYLYLSRLDQHIREVEQRLTTGGL